MKFYNTTLPSKSSGDINKVTWKKLPLLTGKHVCILPLKPKLLFIWRYGLSGPNYNGLQTPTSSLSVLVVSLSGWHPSPDPSSLSMYLYLGAHWYLPSHTQLSMPLFPPLKTAILFVSMAPTCIRQDWQVTVHVTLISSQNCSRWSLSPPWVHVLLCIPAKQS